MLDRAKNSSGIVLYIDPLSTIIDGTYFARQLFFRFPPSLINDMKTHANSKEEE